MSPAGRTRARVARAAPAARSTIKAGAAAIDVVRRRPSGVTILIYHRVGAGTGGQMDLPVDVFAEQMRWLAATQRLLTLDQALDELALVPPPGASSDAGRGEGPRPGAHDRRRGAASGATGVVVTFDDGTRDWVEHAVPILETYGVPATFYVATRFVEEQAPFPGDGEPITWAGLREVASSPLATVGSHTHTHALLDRLPAEQVAHELDRSIDLLGEHLDVTVDHFCYPKALPGSPAADAAVRRRFRSATLAGTRPNHPGTDPFRLARSPVQPADGMRWFRRKVAGGLSAEDDLRRTVNRLRHRSLDT